MTKHVMIATTGLGVVRGRVNAVLLQLGCEVVVVALARKDYQRSSPCRDVFAAMAEDDITGGRFMIRVVFCCASMQQVQLFTRSPVVCATARQPFSMESDRWFCDGCRSSLREVLVQLGVRVIGLGAQLGPFNGRHAQWMVPGACVMVHV
jgi:hypothetical protein